MARSSSSSRTRYLAWLLPALAVVALSAGLLAQGGSPNIRVNDGATVIPNGTGVVAFGSTPPGTPVAKTFTVTNTGTGNLQVGEAISVPQGFTLMASFPGAPAALFGSANNVNSVPAYVIPPSGTATFIVALNSATPGAYSGVVSFATNVTGANPFSFTVNGTVTGSGGGGGVGPAVVTIDDSGPGFTATSDWTLGFNGPGPSGRFPVNNTVAYKPNGTGSGIATYTFSGLGAGQQYRVFVSHVGYGGAATDTPHRIYDGTSTLLSTVRVNQTIDSVGFAADGGVWQLLGTVTITGSVLTVRVADDANGYPTTDAIRIERVGGGGGGGPPPQIVDDSGPGFSATSGWSFFSGPGPSGRIPVNNTVLYAPPGTGSVVATYTFNGLTPGQYTVHVSHVGYGGAATDTPHRIYDGTSTLLSTVRVNQLIDSVGFTEAGGVWQLLGTVTITGSTLTVRVADDANGYPTTDAIRVAAVGGGGGGGGTTEPDAARLLNQATWGPTPTLISAVVSAGAATWVDSQFTAPVSSYPTLPLYNINDNVTNNRTTSCYVPAAPTADETNARNACLRDNYNRNNWLHPLQTRFFTNALYEQDQLRQRVAWQLHKIWVVSAVDTRQPSWMTPYLQLTFNNAFGNFRTLMYQMTLNPAMGAYLDMAGSVRTAPNENYPRELLQLFTIGLYELHPDGSLKLDASNVPIPTYDQGLIVQISKVYTGWNLAPQVAAGIPDYINAMRLGGAATENPANHDFTQKPLLRGFIQPARTQSVANAYIDLNESLDNIYNHPSLAPFICKQLIQGLVTSNPSPGYVARVVDVFNRNKTANNQLQLVVRAILLDPEARGDVKTANNYGKLKEPALYVTNLMRMFDARSANRTANSDGFLNDTLNLSSSQGQSVFRPPSVFSYFAPDRVFVGGNPPVVSGESQTLNTSTALRRVNFINDSFAPANTRVIDVVRSPLTTPTGIYPTGYPQAGQPIIGDYPLGTAVDIAFLNSLATDPTALANELSRLMLNGSMTPELRAEIVTAVNAVTVSATPTDAQRRKRVRTAVYLVATSSAYQVQK